MASSSNRPRKATAPRVIVVEPEASSESETEGRSEQEVAADAVIEETAAANPKAPEATIYRKDAETGQEKWVAKVASSIVSHEWIAKKFGGGEYRVQHRKPNATGKLVYGAQETYMIDPAVQPERPTLGGDGVTATGAPGERREMIMDAALMGLIQQMGNNNTAALEMMRSMNQQPQRETKPLDIVGIITAVSSLVAAIAPFFERKKDAMETAREIAELATKNTGGGGGGVKEMIGGLKELLEVKELLGGGGGDDRGPGERLLEAALPKFMELADHYAQRTAAPAQPPAQLPAVQRPAALPAGAQPPSEASPVWASYVARQVPRWVKLAEMDKNPSLYAELEVDNLPPMFLGMLKTFLKRDDAIDLVLQAFPALAQYEEWSREFFAEIIDLVMGEDDDGEDSEEDDGAATPPQPARRGGGAPPRGAVPTGGGGDQSGNTNPPKPPRSRGGKAPRRDDGGTGEPPAGDSSGAASRT